MALEKFDCDGVIFTHDYVVRTAYAALNYRLNSIFNYPKLFDTTGSRGREGYREFPLLTSGKIWADINGIHECNIVPV
ncbi:putative secreted effector protein [Blumeria graminis f. sp. tritici 96224]|uniref:BgtE-10021 n=1 Tax=Blumeria graminis f. sp. tritici 96224 TaxID=1268274 RepID=A0A381L4M1_BLUGR|nr:putative secreted effector protein [Blumeria graminis f. sp. tritici 96224]